MTRASPPFSPHQKPPKRCSVLTTSTGAASNGAFCIMIRSRSGTFAFQSPPSSASAQTRVAGSVGRHSNSRGPVRTPQIGTASASGSEATLCTTAPARSQTSTSRGNRSYVVMYEYGRWTVSTRMCCPSGAGETAAYSAGAPRSETLPLSTSTNASCEVA